ncbi:hypothetical protein [Roseospira visakhapatnamensis]|uniref:Opacity protein-like surface antigen n=1 Tax=Roseospira visakhapatnamensis TaxID=390880 RepID=A0A7W6WAC5_9PROT|nr:hypothetical protein [Roseospira visakhapatnamensis]MBB4266839.1 opacity protein-like surface antigen [Roseospira visakhapatnamensis]
MGVLDLAPAWAADGLAVGAGVPEPALAGEGPGIGRGLTFVSPLDGTTGGAAGFAAPCLGLGAAERPLSACLSRGGGLDREPGMLGLGVHYGHEGWLHLGAGLGLEAIGIGGDGGLTWSSPLGVGPESAASMAPAGFGQRLSGSLSALLDVNALMGLELGGVRPFLGADVSVGGVHAVAGGESPARIGLPVTEQTTAHGMTWGATLGSNYAVSSGITLDFAYRYIGQETTGPLDPGLGARMGLGGTGVGGDAGEATNHGMSIGLRLSF